MNGLSVGKKPVGIGVGAMADPFSLDPCHPKTMDAVARQIELHAVVLAICEKAGAGGIVVLEPFEELWADFVGALGNAGADDGLDVLAVGTEVFHRIDCCLKDTTNSAAPTCVRGTDDTSMWIGEQHGLAIGC